MDDPVIKKELKRITLGSGILYIMPYTGEIPADDATVENNGNVAGWIKGGAELTYERTIKKIFDDLRKVTRVFTLEELVNFKTGIMTWGLGILSTLISSSTYTDDTTLKKRTLSIGKGGVVAEKEFLLRFVHTFEDGEKLRVQIIGSPTNNFSLKFDPENPTVPDAEFSALSKGGGGELVTITETYK
ncbi:MAG: hypothetical protein FWF10_08025 [Clostridiales bacterium]|nr:hypothetical protein [Clostridiales bacterium]